MSFARKKVVIDSNIIVSAAIYPNSASDNAVRLALSVKADLLITGDRKHLISMHL
jgi:predicted nucleic acid-binding protein